MSTNDFKSMLFPIHLLCTFFLFFLLPNIEFSGESDLVLVSYFSLTLLNFVLSMTLMIAEGQFRLPYPQSFAWLGIFCLLMIGHYGIGLPSESGRVFTLYTLILFFLVFSAAQVIRSEKIALLFLSGIVINGVLQIFRGLNQKYLIYPELRQLADQSLLQQYVENGADGRLMERILEELSAGSFIYPNAYAVWLVLLFFAIYLLIRMSPYIQENKILRIALFSIIGAGGFCVFLAGSKGTILVCAIVLLIGIFLRWVQKRKGDLSFWDFSKIMTPILLLLVVLSVIFSDKILSLKVRFYYWYAGLEMFLNEQHPYLGLGNGAFGTFYTRYKLPQAEEAQRAHNFFITTLTEQGLVGLLVLVLFFVFLMKEILQKKHDAAEESVLICDEEALFPKNVYLLFSFLFLGFYIFLNPGISNIAEGLSYLTLLSMLTLVVLLLLRFFYHRNVLKCLPLEENSIFQILFVSLFLMICFTDIAYALFKIENWPNFQILNEPMTILAILSLLILFVVPALRQRGSVAKPYLPASDDTLFNIMLTLFFVFMIGGDMIWEYPPVVITFLILLMIGVVKNQKIKVYTLSSFQAPLAALLGFGFAFFVFLYFLMPEMTFARYRYLYEYWIVKKEVMHENTTEIKESVLNAGQQRFPDFIYFPYEKARLYYSLGLKYQSVGYRNYMADWYRKAAAEIDICIQIAPQKATLYDFKADLLEGAEESFSEILESREHAVACYPTKPYYQMKLGDTYAKAGEVADALKHYQKALELNQKVHRYIKLKQEESDVIQNYMIENTKKSGINSSIK